MSKLLTRFAEHANTIAETFRAAFAKTKLGDCAVEMSAPEESTRGGHYGLQHVMLRNTSGMAIVAASVHAGERKAELRSFALVARLHAERFKRPPSFTEVDYAAFLVKAAPVFAAFGLQVTTVTDLPDAPAAEASGALTESMPAPENRARTIRFVAILLAILAFGSVALLWGRQMLAG